MITIPGRSKKSGNSNDSAKIQELDKRLSVLEEKIMTHAEDLHERICASLDRIEDRLEDEILPFSVNPLDRLGGSSATDATDAGDALSEFSSTIKLTREHLEALTKTVSVMRGSMLSR